MLEDLNPGADESAISALEAELGIQLPTDFAASLRVHNGESDGWPCKVFADFGAYLGTDRITDEWNQRQEIAEDDGEEFDEEEVKEQIKEEIIYVEGPVVLRMFIRKWIPIMDCNGDVFWAIDLNPAEGGTKGQIIEVDWEGCSWKVVAESFGQFISHYANSLSSGKYRIVDGIPTKEDGA